jgi:hypothetical protein
MKASMMTTIAIMNKYFLMKPNQFILMFSEFSPPASRPYNSSVDIV